MTIAYPLLFLSFFLSFFKQFSHYTSNMAFVGKEQYSVCIILPLARSVFQISKSRRVISSTLRQFSSLSYLKSCRFRYECTTLKRLNLISLTNMYRGINGIIYKSI